MSAGRAPYGARGLKSACTVSLMASESRAPYGARGLKFLVCFLACLADLSRPVRGAWIEMLPAFPARDAPRRVAPRTGRVD